MDTVLITGIEPFDGETLNPSWEAVRALEGEQIAGATLVVHQLPCVIGEVQQQLTQAIVASQPVAVLCFGQAGGRTDISLERVAINLVDARIPDNAGKQPVDEPLVEGGPAAYFTTLPIKAMLRDLRAQGIPASVSHSAGTYNCNAIFYYLSHFIASQRPSLRGGFIHVPYLPQMAVAHAHAPSMALEMQKEAIRIMVSTTLKVGQDIKLVAGATH